MGLSVYFWGNWGRGLLLYHYDTHEIMYSGIFLMKDLYDMNKMTLK